MKNEEMMDKFERIYGDLHDLLPDVVKAHRFESSNSYSIPGIASDYRLFCAVFENENTKLDPLGSSLAVATAYARAKIDFICMPVISTADRVDLANQASGRFEQVIQSRERGAFTLGHNGHVAISEYCGIDLENLPRGMCGGIVKVGSKGDKS